MEPDTKKRKTDVVDLTDDTALDTNTIMSIQYQTNTLLNPEWFLKMAVVQAMNILSMRINHAHGVNLIHHSHHLTYPYIKYRVGSLLCDQTKHSCDITVTNFLTSLMSVAMRESCELAVRRLMQTIMDDVQIRQFLVCCGDTQLLRVPGCNNSIAKARRGLHKLLEPGAENNAGWWETTHSRHMNQGAIDRVEAYGKPYDFPNKMLLSCEIAPDLPLGYCWEGNPAGYAWRDWEWHVDRVLKLPKGSVLHSFASQSRKNARVLVQCGAVSKQQDGLYKSVPCLHLKDLRVSTATMHCLDDIVQKGRWPEKMLLSFAAPSFGAVLRQLGLSALLPALYYPESVPSSRQTPDPLRWLEQYSNGTKYLDEFPSPLIIHILSFLPLPDITRFRRVNKMMRSCLASNPRQLFEGSHARLTNMADSRVDRERVFQQSSYYGIVTTDCYLPTTDTELAKLLRQAQTIHLVQGHSIQTSAVPTADPFVLPCWNLKHLHIQYGHVSLPATSRILLPQGIRLVTLKVEMLQDDASNGDAFISTLVQSGCNHLKVLHVTGKHYGKTSTTATQIHLPDMPNLKEAKVPKRMVAALCTAVQNAEHPLEYLGITTQLHGSSNGTEPIILPSCRSLSVEALPVVLQYIQHMGGVSPHLVRLSCYYYTDVTKKIKTSYQSKSSQSLVKYISGNPQLRLMHINGWTEGLTGSSECHDLLLRRLSKIKRNGVGEKPRLDIVIVSSKAYHPNPDILKLVDPSLKSNNIGYHHLIFDSCRSTDETTIKSYKRSAGLWF